MTVDLDLLPGVEPSPLALLLLGKQRDPDSERGVDCPGDLPPASDPSLVARARAAKEALGDRLFAAGLLAIAGWLLKQDIARRTVRGKGLTRYIAVCLLAGLLAFLGIRKVKKVRAPERAIAQGKQIPRALKGQSGLTVPAKR